MQRKLIKQGEGGYTIYLPKKWVEGKGPKPGDQINIAEAETALIIGAPIKGRKETTIEVIPEKRHEILNILTHT
ncbi:hypothetical protein KY311_04600, partial [Candidatus Woesearchaeota archaeon]|nr:hypothetical protein [Candidatus Woesearchaeota archaeon]